MAIAFDNANSVKGTAVSSLTTSAWTITGSNLLLVAGMGWDASSPPNYSAIKWDGSGGTSLTQLGTTLAFGSFGKLDIATLKAPATGSKTLFGQVSATADGICLGGVSHTGVDQTTTLGTAVTATGTNATPATATVNASSASGEVVIDMSFALENTGASATCTIAVGSGQTQRWKQESIATYDGGTQSTEPGAGTVTMSEVFTVAAGNIDWGIKAVPVKPASSGFVPAWGVKATHTVAGSVA